MRKTNDYLMKLLLFLLLLTTSRELLCQVPPDFLIERELPEKTIIHDIPAMGIGKIFLTDSLFITQDIRAQKDYIKIYNYRNNSLVAQFGKTGRGPGQMITPQLNCLSDDDEYFILYDPNLKRMNFCEISSFSDSPAKSLDFNDFDINYLLKAYRLNDNKIIATGMFQDNLFAACDLQNNLVTKHGELPFRPGRAGNNFYWELNIGNFIITPDKKNLIYTAINFGYICCYEIRESDFIKKWDCWLSEPKYSIRSGRIQWKRDNLMGFMDAVVTNDKIFAIYHGKPMAAIRSSSPEDSPETILVFTLEGKPLAKFNTKSPVVRIGANPDGEIFGITKNLGYDLVRFDPGILD